MTMTIISVDFNGQQKIEETIDYKGDNLLWLFCLSDNIVLIIRNYRKDIDYERINNAQVIDQNTFIALIQNNNHDFQDNSHQAKK